MRACTNTKCVVGVPASVSAEKSGMERDKPSSEHIKLASAAVTRFKNKRQVGPREYEVMY